SGSNVISPVYGTTAGTIAQGNDNRINNGQTAYSWGRGVPVTEANSYSINHITKDLETWNKGSYIQGTGASIVNRPFNSPAGVISVGVANAGFQIIGDRVSENLAFRGWSSTDAFNAWRTLWHSGNLRSNAQNDARYMQVTAPANSITTSDINNWNTAYSQRHTHSNKALLDVINQNL